MAGPDSEPDSEKDSENRYGAITDVDGVLVGSVERVGDGWLTGVTVVVPPPDTIGAVDVRGAAPGTHETDALAPGGLVETVDAVTLTGGSAFGLVAAHGAQRWCEEHGRGFPLSSGGVVPVVPAAVIFDLGRGGDQAARPEEAMGYAAATAAAGGPVVTGTAGAGTGAVCRSGGLKGGLGTASVWLPSGVAVGALVVVNAAGSPCDDDGLLYAAQWVQDARRRPHAPRERVAPPKDAADVRLNTSLAVVATNARLDRSQTRRVASSGHDGLARSLRPVHTLQDGDTVFALSTGDLELHDRVPDLVAVHAAAADAVTMAVLDAVLEATGVRTTAVDIPAYRDLYPSVLDGLG